MSYISKIEVEKRLCEVGGDNFLSKLPPDLAEHVLAAFIYHKRALGYRYTNPSARKNFREWNTLEADIVVAHVEITHNADDLQFGKLSIVTKPARKREVYGVAFEYLKEQWPSQISEKVIAKNLIALYSRISGGNPRTISRALLMKLPPPQRPLNRIGFRHLAHAKDGRPYTPVKRLTPQ